MNSKTRRNRSKMKILRPLVALAAALVVTCVHAQRIPAELTLEKLPQQPLDTIATDDPETFIVIYTNNTWSYYRPGSAEAFRESDVYTSHWDTTEIFSYKDVEYADLPPMLELRLIDDLGEFRSPVRGRVSSKYGVRNRRDHNGADIPLITGEPIFSTFEGKVRYAQYNSGGYGYLVIIRHPNGLETWYAHLSKVNVRPNEYVKDGQVIGFGGNTGRSYGSHLHFETRYQDQSFDPEFLIDFESGSLKYQTFALEKSFFNIRSRASEILEEDEGYDYPLLASGSGGDTASMDILERIAAAQSASSAASTREAINQGQAVYHTVAKGDILGRIAQRYGVTINQICNLNGITRETVLQIGKRLRVR